MNAKVKGTAFALWWSVLGIIECSGKAPLRYERNERRVACHSKACFWWIYHALLCGLSEKKVKFLKYGKKRKRHLA